MNIFSNFIPNRTKTFTYSDPPWMTEDIKNKIKLKNNLYCQCMKHQTQISSFLKVEDLCIEITNLIIKSKEKYYQRNNAKWNDPSLSNKTYWSILKAFYNGKKVHKRSYLRCLLIINLLQIFRKKVMFLTLILQNNAHRSQAVVSCLRKYHIWQKTY